MSKKTSFEDAHVTQIIITVVVEGEWVTLIDCEGNRIGKRIRSEKIDCSGRKIDFELCMAKQIEFEWCDAVKKMQKQIVANSKCLFSPWDRKINSLVRSLWIRVRDQPTQKPNRDKRFQIQSWEEAIPRLRAQAKGHARRAKASEWYRWTENIARNHKRKGS